MRTLEVEIRGRDHRKADGRIVEFAAVADHRPGATCAARPIFEDGAPLRSGEGVEGRCNPERSKEQHLTSIPSTPLTHLYVKLRCTRWGLVSRWKGRVGVSNPVPEEMTSWWGAVVLDGNVEQQGLESVRDVCPWDLEEAAETQQCVDALPDWLRDTVTEEYCKPGNRELKAIRLGIDARQMRRRLDRAHVLLLELFNLSAADLPLEVDYRPPGRPKGESNA
jgi:hypothetical protein